MPKQLLLSLAAVALFVTIVGIFAQKQSSINIAKDIKSRPVQAMTTGNIQIDDHTLKAEIASTVASRSVGLGGRSSLPQDSGMLFVFESKQTIQNFWMKDMLIPLDFIWISGGKIVKIDKNVLPPIKGTPDGKLVIYSPGQPIDYVLEVNANYSDKNGIKAGDSISLPAL